MVWAGALGRPPPLPMGIGGGGPPEVASRNDEPSYPKFPFRVCVRVGGVSWAIRKMGVHVCSIGCFCCVFVASCSRARPFLAFGLFLAVFWLAFSIWCFTLGIFFGVPGAQHTPFCIVESHGHTFASLALPRRQPDRKQGK